MTFIELKEEIEKLKAELKLRADYAQQVRDLLVENRKLKAELEIKNNKQEK